MDSGRIGGPAGRFGPVMTPGMSSPHTTGAPALTRDIAHCTSYEQPPRSSRRVPLAPPHGHPPTCVAADAAHEEVASWHAEPTGWASAPSRPAASTSTALMRCSSNAAPVFERVGPEAGLAGQGRAQDANRRQRGPGGTGGQPGVVAADQLRAGFRGTQRGRGCARLPGQGGQRAVRRGGACAEAAVFVWVGADPLAGGGERSAACRRCRDMGGVAIWKAQDE